MVFRVVLRGLTVESAAVVAVTRRVPSDNTALTSCVLEFLWILLGFQCVFTAVVGPHVCWQSYTTSPHIDKHMNCNLIMKASVYKDFCHCLSDMGAAVAQELEQSPSNRMIGGSILGSSCHMSKGKILN